MTSTLATGVAQLDSQAIFGVCGGAVVCRNEMKALLGSPPSPGQAKPLLGLRPPEQPDACLAAASASVDLRAAGALLCVLLPLRGDPVDFRGVRLRVRQHRLRPEAPASRG